MTKLSDKSKKIIAEFAEAAKGWGYQEDSGTGNKEFTDSLEDYEKTMFNLVKHITSLESKIKKLEKEREKSCSNCEEGRSNGFKCNRTNACETPERKFWKPKEKIK